MIEPKEKKTTLLKERHLPDKPKTVEEAANVLKDIRENIKKDTREMDLTSPTVGDPVQIKEELLAILKHFLQPGPIRLAMALKIKGASYPEIGRFLSITEEGVRALEQKGMELVKKGVDRDPSYQILSSSGKLISGRPRGLGIL